MALVSTFLMFEGDAEAAVTFYVSLFADARIDRVERYGADGPGIEGKVKHAAFTLNRQAFRCGDSIVKHAFTFTPSLSIFVECADEPEIDRLAAALDAGEKVFMPLGAYGFSRKFAWVQDRFGVSWQLNLP